jgi:hypothetical protein
MVMFELDGYSISGEDYTVTLLLKENQKYKNVACATPSRDWIDRCKSIIEVQEKKLIISTDDSNLFYCTHNFNKMPEACVDNGNCFICKKGTCNDIDIIHPWECRGSVHRSCITKPHILAPYYKNDEDTSCVLCGAKVNNYYEEENDCCECSDAKGQTWVCYCWECKKEDKCPNCTSKLNPDVEIPTFECPCETYEMCGYCYKKCM